MGADQRLKSPLLVVAFLGLEFGVPNQVVLVAVCVASSCCASVLRPCGGSDDPQVDSACQPLPSDRRTLRVVLAMLALDGLMTRSRAEALSQFA